MCATCGCDQPGGVNITKVGKENVYELIASAPLMQQHSHKPADQKRIQVEQDILSKNTQQAEHNRYHFEAAHILAINLVSSPGSGKTSLLERTLKETRDQFKSYVIEGDQQTMNDANRIAATGSEVVQINTGKGCHLDADMIHRALHKLDPQENSIVYIENVGNLVCPAMFDLGENARIAIISVTEGDDKPLKYPDMFETSNLCIINKIDLLQYVNFSVSRAKEYAHKINPRLSFIELSATTGEGMNHWYEWLKARFDLVQNQYSEISSLIPEV